SADFAQSDDSDCLSFKVVANKVIEGKVVSLDLFVGQRDFAVERLNHGDGMLGDGIGGVFGDVADADAELVGLADIGLVVARRSYGDVLDTHSGQLFEYGSGAVVVG